MILSGEPRQPDHPLHHGCSNDRLLLLTTAIGRDFSVDSIAQHPSSAGVPAGALAGRAVPAEAVAARLLLPSEASLMPSVAEQRKGRRVPGRTRTLDPARVQFP